MKIIAFLLVILTSFSVYSEEIEPYDYEEVTKGQIVPYDGLLFTYDGITKAVIRIQSKIKLCDIEKNEEVQKTKNNLQFIIDSKVIELDAKKNLYESQLKYKQDLIDSLQRDSYWQKIKLAGGVTLGVATGFFVGYLVTKLN